ncbi:5'-adenylylsulfate reductase 1, chloroplastic isoform X4 [Helianthus annuus]|uniref:5'-adenylylsulfate reductase 1, chloroplastic isoform X4 n=1 Tax=Helianthus annuus TaxID=4232 RepID=UPI000B9083BF|nr:5'-adenylylsulfate reductase 1, chloroplastic isoform X4 [Helianthus annuus]
MPSTDSLLLPRVQGNPNGKRKLSSSNPQISINSRLQFSASNLQTLDRNFLSPATLNISWKRFATVKALNAENDSVIPFTATVFAHGASNLWALIIDARAVFCSVAYELSSIFFTRTGSWDSCSQWKLFSCYNKGHFHIFPFA